tara:strand:+ start:188 stop:508 length:321 start_codon:yes stop_codon:yes gene_type:complete
MKIEIQTNSYNERRYGRPYIAKILFDDHKGSPAWGSWVGDPRNGSEGLLILDCDVNDIVMTGQKDSRNARNSAPTYHVVKEGGALQEVSKVEAYRLYKDIKTEIQK